MKLTNAQRSKLMDVPKSHDWSVPNPKLEIAIELGASWFSPKCVEAQRLS